MVPLYKQKGDRGDPDNQRLQTLADEGGLRAPTQAGFRPGYTVEDLGLVLQVCI